MNKKQIITKHTELINHNIRPILCGWCFDASLALGIKLATFGINSTRVRGEFRGCSHGWIEAEDLICDPTSGQYENMPRYFVGEKSSSPDYISKDIEYINFEQIAISLGFDVYSWSEIVEKNIEIC